MKNKKLTFFIDGGSRGNPGPAGLGVVILDRSGAKVKDVFKYIGETTNNVAEYSALICALEEAVALGAEEILLNIDSQLVVKQMNGEYRVKSAEIKPLFEKALGMLHNFKSYTFAHIDREKNKDADRLANKAMNLAGLVRDPELQK